MFPIALEETWKTHYWPCHVFQFLLAVTEVNIQWAITRIFGRPAMSQQAFQQAFAKELIYNNYINIADTSVSLKCHSWCFKGHILASIPKNKKFNKVSCLMPCKTMYIQKVCCICKTRCRTYCRCSPGIMYCKDCFPEHIAEADNEELVIN